MFGASGAIFAGRTGRFLVDEPGNFPGRPNAEIWLGERGNCSGRTRTFFGVLKEVVDRSLFGRRSVVAGPRHCQRRGQVFFVELMRIVIFRALIPNIFSLVPSLGRPHTGTARAGRHDYSLRSFSHTTSWHSIRFVPVQTVLAATFAMERLSPPR